MCKGSLLVANEPAVVGMVLAISTLRTEGLTRERTFGVFHRRGVAPSACIVCVKDGMQLALNGIPKQLREQYDLEKMIVVTFIDRAEDREDMILLESGVRIPLRVFSNLGIVAHVGVIVAMKPVPQRVLEVEFL